MTRVLMVAALVAVTGCAALQRSFNAFARGDVAGGVTEVGSEARRLDEAARQCDALAKQKVTYEEETGIGGAVALALADKTQGVYIEVSPDLAGNAPTPGVKPRPGKGPRTDLTTYINLVGKTLAAASARPGLDWTFVVLESSTPNAFSAPGGYVFITTGLLALLDNEAQLAAALAHEIGHITGRHSLVAYSKSKATACSLALVGSETVNAVASRVQLGREFRAALGVANLDLNAASKELIADVTNRMADTLITVGNGDDFEFAADGTAYELMVFSGYDPREFEKLIVKLPDGGFLSPHPSNKDRLAKLGPRKAEYASWTEGLKAPELAPVAKALKK